MHKLNKSGVEKSLKKIKSGVLKNIKEGNDFWKNYENPFEFFFDRTYDIYLKINGQDSGIKSYNEVVSLIINYHKYIEEF